jgi:hypothetical protein
MESGKVLRWNIPFEVFASRRDRVSSWLAESRRLASRELGKDGLLSVSTLHRVFFCQRTIFLIVLDCSNRICLGTIRVDQTLVLFPSDWMSIADRLA